MNKLSIVIPLGKGSEFSSADSITRQKIKADTIVRVGSNPSRNRNLGIKKAKGELVAFINGHTILADDWAEKVIEFFRKNPNVDIAGGPQRTSSEERGIARVSGYALSSKFGAWKIANRYSGKKEILDADETMLTSANLICRKKVFRKIKFDESIYPGEDPKFVSDAKNAGFKVAYSPEIIVYNKRRNTLSELARQIFNYGKTRPQKESLKETLKRPFFIIPSVFVLYLLTLVLVSLGSITLTGGVTAGDSGMGGRYYILFAPFAAYIIISLLVSIGRAISNRDAIAFILLPMIFLVIHASYGVGFLASTFNRTFKK